MASFADRVYNYAPVPIQNLLVSIYGIYWNRLRFGGNFEAERKGFLERESFSAEDWKAYQEQQLRDLLLSAWDTAPYYQEAWRGIVNRKQLESFTLADLQKLPPLDKQIARDRPLDLLVGGQPQKDHLKFYTSGSTGSPVTTYWRPHELQRSLALREIRSCRPASVSFKMPRATFSGRMVEPRPKSNGPFHRFNFIEKQVYFSAFHLNPKNVPQYIAALWQHKTRWITGYSNSIYQLAEMALDQNMKIPRLDAIITTSEKLSPEMRATIERAFQCRVYEEYAAVEDLFFVSENEYQQKLISPDAGILEIVDEQFQAVANGEMGEVLVTGFIRKNQPMIRYRIGDIARLSDEPAQCGRQMPVLAEVIGRQEDTVYAPDGRRMVRFHGIFVNQPHIQEGQIVQEKLNLIRAKIVPKADYNAADEQDIIARIQQRLTSDMNVIVEVVDEIPRSKAGKFRAVLNQLSPEELARIQRV